ncbi:cell wall-binding repeat-containing protein [Herbiconiux sp.]|uniref:cell wall-binding repeat-containing protein n=1 Tax=Herbiconiux sp. TaxID=1871186 RepID=UPI0025BB3C39|nr:cell wall-binding repeat-containing protein [Herbiconiux sp.]
MAMFGILRRSLTLAAFIALFSSAMLVAPAASAIGTSDLELTLVDSATIGVDGSPSGIEVNSRTHFGYIVDRASAAVLVFDLNDGTLAPVASIPTTISLPTAMSIDEAGTRLLVASFNSSSIAVIDVDAASPTFNTVLRVIGADGVFATALVVDGDFVYVGDDIRTARVKKIDLRDGTTTTFSTGPVWKIFVVDPSTHIAYVGARDGRDVWEIGIDGSVTHHSVPTAITAMVATESGLVVASSQGLIRIDPTSWTVEATSARVDVWSVAVDESRDVLYTSGALRITMLDPVSLDLKTSFRTLVANKVAVDQSVGTVLTSGGSSVEMYSATPTVARVSGGDRYEVSAAVSKRQFAPMVPVVYVASGEVFSDALSASAAAGAHGGAVLLVRKNEIPGVVAAELTRLTPQRIVLLGGSSTISATVENELKSFSTDVIRIAGADRYEVSATVSSKAFGTARPIAYVAAGTTFADALSGSAAAGRLGGPVLLVPKDSVPISISNELRRLAPAKIVVLGGTASVSQAVVDALALIQPNTVRIAGDDRFAVSAKVSSGAFPTPTTTVYVSSGLVYPDALSGSAAAIATGSPVLLVRSDSIPTAIAAELDRLDPRRIVILGGTNSVSAAVEAKLRSFITV